MSDQGLVVDAQSVDLIARTFCHPHFPQNCDMLDILQSFQRVIAEQEEAFREYKHKQRELERRKIRKFRDDFKVRLPLSSMLVHSITLPSLHHVCHLANRTGFAGRAGARGHPPRQELLA